MFYFVPLITLNQIFSFSFVPVSFFWRGFQGLLWFRGFGKFYRLFQKGWGLTLEKLFGYKDVNVAKGPQANLAEDDSGLHQISKIPTSSPTLKPLIYSITVIVSPWVKTFSWCFHCGNYHRTRWLKWVSALIWPELFSCSINSFKWTRRSESLGSTYGSFLCRIGADHLPPGKLGSPLQCRECLTAGSWVWCW